MSEEKIVERIRKMLALANDKGATEPERETALRMAYNLLAKYNLSLTDVEAKKQSERRVDNSNVCFGMPWVRKLSGAIAELFFCNYYFGAKVNATQIHHHFVGKESNAITAAVMADWITKSILKECRTLYTHNLCPESRSFATGAAERLQERIREMRRQAEAASVPSDCKALVLADVYQLERTANDTFLTEQGVKLVTVKSRTKNVSSDAYGRGRQFGDKINLNRQVGTVPVANLK